MLKTTAWVSSLGACVRPDGIFFRVWAPSVSKLEVVPEGRDGFSLERSQDGYFSGRLELPAGALYRYRVDGAGLYPDPASRFQPSGVHGPSQVIDPSSFAWSDALWRGAPLRGQVLYELHVGTFSSEGTFAGVRRKLPALVELGVTAVELMPVASFPGGRNWGYDGAALFAPAACYGSPDDLRALVDAAHALRLCVVLDVVYNHFGPDGNYTGIYSSDYLTEAHRSPWGAGVNLDQARSGAVRDFFVENALHWIHEYHLDGLRLDATHAMVDDSPEHFAAELARRARASLPPERRVFLVAEDHRNLAAIVKARTEGGWELDGVWSDDFSHQVRRILAGDQESYYGDFKEDSQDLADILNRGWLFSGQFAPYFNGPRGTDPGGLSPEQFIVFIENHDQVGNRAFGDRLCHQLDAPAYRVAVVVLLTAPQTPLLFMGQEWADSAPFLYFTDHEPQLGRLVTQGRRKEFAGFSAFRDEVSREAIPNPQARETFEKSRLHWDERGLAPHQGVWRLHQTLLRLRSQELRPHRARDYRAAALNADVVTASWTAGRERYLAVVMLRGSGELAALAGERELLMTTEEDRFCRDPKPIRRTPAGGLRFERPGAVILRGR